MPRTRPPYPPEFRQEAVRLLRASGKTIPVLADELGVSPQSRRGKSNEPAFVTITAEFVAELRGTSYKALEQVVRANSAWLFGW